MDLQSAKNARVDFDPHGHRLAETPRQLGGDAIPVVRSKLDRGGQGRAHAPGGGIGEVLELVGDGADLVNSIGLDEELREVCGLGLERRRRDEIHATLAWDCWVGEHGGHFLVRHQVAKLRQAARPLVDLTLIAGELEHGTRISLSGCRRHLQPPRSPCR